MHTYETLTWVAPLGLRFWDVALNTPVTSGLEVTAHRGGAQAPKVTATVSPSGFYGFAHLPGLHNFETGAGDAAFWKELPTRQKYTYQVLVVDTQKRFLPCTFEVEAPAKGPTCPSYLAEAALTQSLPAQTIPLFSTPARTCPNAWAALRIDLYDKAHAAETPPKPAAWAILEIGFGGRCLAWGVANATGKIALFFSYPPVPPHTLPLRERSWDLKIAVRYGGLLKPDSTPPYPAGGDPPLLLDSILKQETTQLWQSPSSPPFIFTEQVQMQLKFGEECTLPELFLWVEAVQQQTGIH